MGVGLIERLFPKTDKDRRYSAWEMYLTVDLFETVVQALCPQYEQAISEMKSLRTESIWLNQSRSLLNT